MRKSFIILRTFLSLFAAAPHAIAYEYQEYCNLDEASNEVHATIPSAQTNANCATAHISKLTRDFEKTKALIQFPIAVYLGIAAFTPWAGSCPWVAGAGIAIGIAADTLLGAETGSVMKVLGERLKSEAATVVPLAVGLFNAKAVEAAAGSSTGKSDCIAGAGILTIEAINSLDAAGKADDAKDAAIKQNLDLYQARGSSGFKVGDLPQSVSSLAGQPANIGATVNPKGIPDCSKQTGKNLASCALGNDAISAAITNNPDTMGKIEKMIGGQSLDKFAAGFTGKTKDDLMNYTAKAMGISGDQMKALASTLDGAQKVAKDAGIFDKYIPSGFSAAGGARVAFASDEDSLNKAMAGLLGKLNKGDEEKILAGETPMASLSRKLDLLPESDIVNNPKIDLFKRVEIRYLKTTSKLGLREPAVFTNKP